METKKAIKKIGEKANKKTNALLLRVTGNDPKIIESFVEAIQGLDGFIVVPTSGVERSATSDEFRAFLTVVKIGEVYE